MTTFVTSIVHLYEKEPYEHKNIEWRISHFKKIAETGIPIVVYYDNTTFSVFEQLFPLFRNIHFFFFDYKKTSIYKECIRDDLELPICKNEKKDTKEYMGLMNTKIEFVRDAIKKNVWKTDHFAWFDFSMAYLFHTPTDSLEKIKNFQKIPEGKRFLCIPGCWNRPSNVQCLLNVIHWRFCGSFFIGDKETLLQFYDAYLSHFSRFLNDHKKIVWEVNVWAWLENENLINPTWYNADHNDRIIDAPM